MNIEEILRSTDHRPWPIPTNSWSYYQEWNNAIFLHWEVELSELKKHVPKELQIDTFQGKTWVSVVAFTMEKIRPKNLPYFNPISNFHEINIRTYVKANGKTGVYFLSIEAAKRVSCLVARKISKLPYRYSKIKIPSLPPAATLSPTENISTVVPNQPFQKLPSISGPN